MVVPEGKFIQEKLDVLRLKQNPVGNGLEGSKEAFNPSVLPGAMQSGLLMANTQQPEAEVEKTRSENRFVVRSDRFGFSKRFDCQNQDFKKGDGCLVSQSFKAQAFSGSMIDDAKNVSSLLGRVRDTREIHCPDQISRNRFRNPAFPRFTDSQDISHVSAQDACNKSLADGDAFFGCETPVENVRHCTAPRVVRMRLDLDKLPLNPCRLRPTLQRRGFCFFNKGYPTSPNMSCKRQLSVKESGKEQEKQKENYRAHGLERYLLDGNFPATFPSLNSDFREGNQGRVRGGVLANNRKDLKSGYSVRFFGFSASRSPLKLKALLKKGAFFVFVLIFYFYQLKIRIFN